MERVTGARTPLITPRPSLSFDSAFKQLLMQIKFEVLTCYKFGLIVSGTFFSGSSSELL